MMRLDLRGLRAGRWVLAIDRLRCVRIDAPSGVTLHCLAGEIWLTPSGSASDRFLRAGARCELPEKGVVFVDALRDESVVELSRAAGTTGSTAESVIRCDFRRRAAATASGRPRASAPRIPRLGSAPMNSGYPALSVDTVSNTARKGR